MKCIMSIKQSKNTEIGTIKRINDVDADSNVKSGYWKYVPKSEWKKTFVTEKVENQVVPNKTTKNKKIKSK
jgi:hypothetical protein